MNKLSLSIQPGYQYSPIVYFDTYLSLDPIVGCQNNCQYCFMQINSWTGVKKPIRLFSVDEIIQLLLNSKYFIPKKTVLCFGNQTDAFLPINIDYTTSILKELDNLKITNPIVFITKELIPSYFIDMLCDLKYIKPIFILSYSGLSNSIEKGVNPKDVQHNFVNLHSINLPIIHFWRPLTILNSNSEQIFEMLNYVTKYAKASVYIGLRLNPSLNLIYNKNHNLRIPDELQKQYGEYLPASIENRIKNVTSKYFPNYPLYKHASCAISLILSIPDYNATMYNLKVCENSLCPPWKRKICYNSRKTPSKSIVTQILKVINPNLKYRLNQDSIFIYGDINQEDYIFLLHNLNFPIISNQLNHNLILRGSNIKYGKRQ